MIPTLVGGNVRANCPHCAGAVTTFEFAALGREYVTVILESAHQYREKTYQQILYKLARCAGCGKGGLAEIHHSPNAQIKAENLGDFFPFCIERHQIPKDVPFEIKTEFEEAELCASIRAWRSASAMLRSVLEKTLKINGYDRKGENLKSRIELAVSDGVLTEARSRRANDNIRVLGNDVLHDPWREVTSEEYADAHLYAQRILEDFYDDRPTVLAILIDKKRLHSSS